MGVKFCHLFSDPKAESYTRNLAQMIFLCSYITFLTSTCSRHSLPGLCLPAVCFQRKDTACLEEKGGCEEWDGKEVAFRMEGFSWTDQPWLPDSGKESLVGVEIMIVVVQSLSPIQLFATPWIPGFPVLHCLPEFAQIHVHWVSYAIQPSHLLPRSSFAFSLSQHQSLFQWVDSSYQVAKVSTRASASTSVFPVNIRGWFPLGLTGLISLPSNELSRVFSGTTIQ